MEKTKRKCITKFGITEQGDPSLDFSWVNKLYKCSGAIIISKGFNDKFNEFHIIIDFSSNRYCEVI